LAQQHFAIQNRLLGPLQILFPKEKICARRDHYAVLAVAGDSYGGHSRCTPRRTANEVCAYTPTFKIMKSRPANVIITELCNHVHRRTHQ
jgi:hypothetical protein